MSNLAFTLTARELDALLALDANRAAWRTFGPRTWETLAGKGLVGFGSAPGLTAAGRAFLAFWRALPKSARGCGPGVANSLTSPSRHVNVHFERVGR